MRVMKVWAFNSNSSQLRELGKVTSKGSSISENWEVDSAFRKKGSEELHKVCVQ